MRGVGVIEDLRQGAYDMFVVVKDLAVVAACAAVPLYEDLVGSVDHHLPDVVVSEKRFERPVTGDVSEGSLCDELRISQIEVAATALVVLAPAGDFVVNESTQLRAAVTACHVERDVLGPLLHGALDVSEG
jgi:hypothetical protein